MNHGSMINGSMNHGSMNHGSMNHGSMNHGSMNHGAMPGLEHSVWNVPGLEHGTFLGLWSFVLGPWSLVIYYLQSNELDLG